MRFCGKVAFIIDVEAKCEEGGNLSKRIFMILLDYVPYKQKNSTRFTETGQVDRGNDRDTTLCLGGQP